MIDIKKEIKEGQKIWFIDSGFENGKCKTYAEHGVAGKIKDGQCVIYTYFTYDDNFTLPVEDVYTSKEACEEAIYLKQLTNELPKQNPTIVKIVKQKEGGGNDSKRNSQKG